MNVRGASSDHQLIASARTGSKSAFQALVERYQTLAFSMAYGVTGSFEDSEEVAQEAFLIAWRRLHEIQEPEHFRGWLSGIVRFVGRRTRQRRRRQVPEDLSTEVPSSDPSPLERLVSAEELRVVQRALAAIPEIYRASLVLYYHEHGSVQRVAEALAISDRAVKMRLSRGRRMLQTRVQVMVAETLGRLRPRDGRGRRVARVIAFTVTTRPQPAVVCRDDGRDLAFDAQRPSLGAPRAPRTLGG